MADTWKSDQEIIGKKIQEARKAAHMTQEQLSEEMGGTCTNKVISRYEKRSNNEKIGQLLKAYGCKELSALPPEKYEAFLTDISQL